MKQGLITEKVMVMDIARKGRGVTTLNQVKEQKE